MGSPSAEEARAIARRVAAGLAEDPRIRLVVLFGSAAESAPVTVEDVDLAVVARPAIALDDLLRRVAELSRGSGVPVDVVDAGDAPPVLAKEIADGGETLFSRTPEDEVAFVTRARARFWDFKPYLDEQTRLIRERQEKRLRGSQT